MENKFEFMLWNSRLILVVAVICCVLAALTLVGLGASEVLHLIHGFYNYIGLGSDPVTRDALVLIVIEILDTFLLASILFIFSFGMYELFISSIEEKRNDISKAFQIDSIDELKAKLGKVIVMLLTVKTFAFLVEIKPTNMLEMVYLAVIVLLISVSLWLGHKKG